jgi:hypothetical protein
LLYLLILHRNCFCQVFTVLCRKDCSNDHSLRSRNSRQHCSDGLFAEGRPL